MPEQLSNEQQMARVLLLEEGSATPAHLINSTKTGMLLGRIEQRPYYYVVSYDALKQADVRFELWDKLAFSEVGKGFGKNEIHLDPRFAKDVLIPEMQKRAGCTYEEARARFQQFANAAQNPQPEKLGGGETPLGQVTAPRSL